jgi:hypothetical protein
MAISREEQRERLNQVAELLGMSPQELVALAAGGAQAKVAELEEPVETPPAIVYPNVKFPRYKFREYPKCVYGNARIEDIEETVTKLIPRDGGGVDQKVFIRVIPDQFRYDTREVASAAEEANLPDGWFLTLPEAKEAARAAKATARPIVERPARGRPRRQHPAETAPAADEGGDDDGNPMAEVFDKRSDAA